MRGDLTTTGVWALDFIRAYNERPFWAKLLARFIFGKYAYVEFMGMVISIKQSGHDPFFSYMLEEVDYQKLISKDWKWWRDEQ